MIQIEVSNSFSRITGLSPVQFKRLKDVLSYQLDAKAVYFSKAYRVYKRYLIDDRGNFPTGLLNRTVATVKEWEAPVISDKRIKPKPFSSKELSTKFPIPYDVQVEATNAAVKHHRGGIIMPTGTGKSIVMAMIIRKLKVRTLVVVPTLEIKKQLQESFDQLFSDSSFITVENVDSVSDGDYDCLIIDECHHSAAKTYQKLNKMKWKNIYYRFFLTATYFRNQENEHLLFEAICGERIYKLSFKEALEELIICPVETYYYDIPVKKTEAYKYNEVYSELVVHNETRNNIIGGLLSRLSEQGVPTLCLVKEIAHGKILESLTGIPFVNGEDEDSRQYIKDFNVGHKKCLIGTTGILGEGVDTKPAEYIVIAGLGKAKSMFLQQIGRGVRNYPGKKSCKVVLFRDTSHKFTLRHFKEQVKILKEELGIDCLKLE